MSAPEQYEPFPNMSTRQLRMIVSAAVNDLAHRINKLEQEYVQHKAFPPESPMPQRADWLAHPRHARISEIEDQLRMYGEVYIIARQVMDRLKNEQIERDAEAMAAHFKASMRGNRK